MIEVHYGVVRIEGGWSVISRGLRLGRFETQAQAETLMRRMADQAPSLPVVLHLQDETGELHTERRAEHRGE